MEFELGSPARGLSSPTKELLDLSPSEKEESTVSSVSSSNKETSRHIEVIMIRIIDPH